MRRKRIKVNRIKGVGNRRRYVRDAILRIENQLRQGWNPWIAQDVTNLLVFEDALTQYEAYIEKMLVNGYFRKETYLGYRSYIKILREYIKDKNPLYYVYQFGSQGRLQLFVEVDSSISEPFHRIFGLFSIHEQANRSFVINVTHIFV